MGEIGSRSSAKRILILDEEFPFPLNSGKRIRSYNLLKHLARDFSVDYLAYGDSSSDKDNALRLIGVTPISVVPHSHAKHGLKFGLKLARSMFSNVPYIVRDHFSKIFKRYLLDLIQENEYDLIVVEWTPYAKFVEGIMSIPHVIVAHNIEWRIWEGYLNQETLMGKKQYIRGQIRRLMNFEKKVWNAATGVIAVSGVESEIIENFTQHTKVTVVENGVDVKMFSDGATQMTTSSTAPTMVFVGALDWRPNQDAVRFLIEDIVPIVRAGIPDIRTLIVGRNPSEQILRYGLMENIEVAGSVADVRPYMKRDFVFVVPLRIGGGSRLKILEAAAMKMGIVTTERGSDGLSLEGGRHYLQANDPKCFAKHVADLLQDRCKRLEMGVAAQNHVRKYYDWSIVYQEYLRFVNNLIDDKSLCN